MAEATTTQSKENIEQKQTPANLQKDIKKEQSQQQRVEASQNKEGPKGQPSHVVQTTREGHTQQQKAQSTTPHTVQKPKASPNISKDTQQKEVSKPQQEKSIKPQLSQPIFKVFNTWSPEGVVVKNIALRDYISIRPLLVPKTGGKFADQRFWKAKYHIIERLINHIQVAGHKRKKHHKSSGKNTGKTTTVYNIVKQAFKEIQNKTKQNPLQVLVDAIENTCPRQGIITIEYGGVRYPKAVDLSPLKRVDLSIRWLAQQAFHSSSTSKKPHKRMYQVLADELTLAAKADQNSAIIKKKIELEKQAAASK